MPEIAKISVDYSNFNDFTIADRRKSNKPINALTLARYCLYNRDLPDFGLNNSVYLAYTGGFITQESKINTKYSDFQIKRRSTSNGNIYVSGASNFFGGISLGRNASSQATSNIKNARILNNIDELKGSNFNNDPLTLKDFKNFMYHPGMITLYNGTWEDVRDKMPFWRICALPDAGAIVNTTSPGGDPITVRVPNLLGRFLPGSQPVDIPEGGEYFYKTGNTGGHDAIKLNVSQVPRHDHNVNITWTGDEPPIVTGLGNFARGGGIISVVNETGRRCNFRRVRPKCGCKNGTCTTRCIEEDKNKKCTKTASTSECKNLNNDQGVLEYTSSKNIATVTSLNIESYGLRTLKLNNRLPRIISQTQQTVGSDGQHENRPLFYGLVPIIYVGVKRQ